MDIVQELAKKVYLGDGVYAYHDGYQVWLTIGSGRDIALEPEVMAELVRYDADVKKKIRAHNEQCYKREAKEG